MYICSCNPFTDKDLAKALEDVDIKNTPAHVYKAASGGQTPCCGSCMCVVKEKVVNHNAALGVRQIKEGMPAFVKSGELVDAE